MLTTLDPMPLPTAYKRDMVCGEGERRFGQSLIAHDHDLRARTSLRHDRRVVLNDLVHSLLDEACTSRRHKARASGGGSSMWSAHWVSAQIGQALAHVVATQVGVTRT